MKPIPDFPGYAITTFGDVYCFFGDVFPSLDDVEAFKRDRVLKRKPVLKNGYLHLNLIQNGQRVRRYIHTLMLEAFIGPRPTLKHECRHLNGIQRDNNISNLAWGTRKENVQDMLKHRAMARKKQ